MTKRSHNKSPPSNKKKKKQQNVSSSLSNVDNPPSSSSSASSSSVSSSSSSVSLSSHPSLSIKLTTTPVKKVKKVIPSSSSSSASSSSSTHPSLSTKLITNSTTPVKKVKKVKKVIPSSSSSPPSSSSSSPSKPSNDIDNISNSSDFSLEFPTSSTLLIYPNVSNYLTITSSSSNNDDEFDYDYYVNLPQHEDYDDDDETIDDSDETISTDNYDSTKLSDGILNLYRPLGWCKNPPKPSSVFVDENKENQRMVANIYIPYLKALYNDFPTAFTPIHVENLALYENILSNNLPFEYEHLFNVVKNISYRITKSDEQRQRDNETNIARVERKRLAGYCSCNEPLCVNNKAKCQTCSDKEANRAIESYRAAKAKGWCGYCKKPFSQDGICTHCANNLVNRKLRCLQLYQTKVKGLPENAPIECNRCKIGLENAFHSVCFTLHHDRYLDPTRPEKRCKNTISFNAAVEKHGIEWFQKEETLELLCRSCHAVEHASTTKSDSKWADVHWQVVELFECACSGCGLSYYDDDQCEDMEKLKKMFHIHHVHIDGAERRRQAGEKVDDEKWQLQQCE